MDNKEKKDNNDNSKSFLLLYAIVIVVVFVLIMFIIPDDIFMLKYKNSEIPNEKEPTEKIEFTDYEVQKDRLLNKNYDYEYVLLDSMGLITRQYTCEGKIKNNMETGTCTMPEEFSYTESNKKDLFKINTKYIEFKGIMELVEGTTPEEVKYTSLREYHYNDLMIEDLKTEIVIYTDADNITKIELSNKYMTYILKYSNVAGD